MTEEPSFDEVWVRPIGVVHAPYKEPDEVPIQGVFGGDTEAYIELQERYVPGLQGLDGFSHAWAISYFHRSSREELVERPYLEGENTAYSPFAARIVPTIWGCPSSG